MVAESSAFTTSKEIQVFGQFRPFFNIFKYFEKRSKLTKNLDFFGRGKRATLSHHFESS